MAPSPLPCGLSTWQLGGVGSCFQPHGRITKVVCISFALTVKVKGAQSCRTLCDPVDCGVHGILQARILEWVAFPFSRGSSNPRSPTLRVDSLPTEPQGKPKNTGVGSLSLLQRIFPTLELNRGLLHWRQILYQLSYEGSFALVRW